VGGGSKYRRKGQTWILKIVYFLLDGEGKEVEFRHSPKRECMATSCIWKDDTESVALYSFLTLTLGVDETVPWCQTTEQYSNTAGRITDKYKWRRW